MTIKQTSIHVLASALLAICASVVYNAVYSSAFELDFSSILNIGGIVGSTLIGCLLMGLAYYLGYRWKGEKLFRWINILISVLSFVTIMGVLGMQLPLAIENPEMFPGLAIPMHFFPALSFLVVYSFFEPRHTNK